VQIGNLMSYKEPYGLGMDPAKFHAYLAAEIGE
jgi:hypothetical protein